MTTDANIHKLWFEIQQCTLNATAEGGGGTQQHNSAIVCASCDGSYRLYNVHGLYSHRPQYFPHSCPFTVPWIFLPCTPRLVACVRLGTLPEFIIKTNKVTIARVSTIYIHVIASTNTVPSTSTDVAMSVAKKKTCVCIIAVRREETDKKKKKNGRVDEPRSRTPLQYNCSEKAASR